MFEVGEKVKGVEIEIGRTSYVESYYGSSLMVSGWFKDTSNQFVSFLSGKTDFLYNEDQTVKETVKVDFTVKDHQDRGYGKQTLLTRFRKSK